MGRYPWAPYSLVCQAAVGHSEVPHQASGAARLNAKHESKLTSNRSIEANWTLDSIAKSDVGLKHRVKATVSDRCP